LNGGLAPFFKNGCKSREGREKFDVVAKEKRIFVAGKWLTGGPAGQKLRPPSTKAWKAAFVLSQPW
jgi:hypothetical protein